MQIGIQKAFKTVQDASNASILEKGWASLRQAFAFFWKHRLLTCAAFIIVFFTVGAYHYVQSLRIASTIVSLDYEEAARGLTPSQTRFNIFEIESTEVMERLLDYAGLQGVVSPADLSKCISVRATHSKNVSGKVNFISTSYVIEFVNDKLIERRTAETMLTLLCKAYREFFVEHYGVNHAILSFDFSDLEFNDEYLMAIDLLELKCNQLNKYVQLRRRESKNFQDSDTGITFNALVQRISNLYTYDLARLRSYVIENGIANDKQKFNGMLDYKIRMEHLIYDKLMAAYEEDNKGIKIYDVAMSAIVMIPTEDSSRKYYMSRTKTGMDNMAIHADGQLYGATEKKADIEYSTYLIGKMQTNSPAASHYQKANEMIIKIRSALEALASDIKAVDKSYTSYRARNFLSFSSNYMRFSDRVDIVNTAIISIVFLGMAFTAVFLRCFITQKAKKA